MKHFYIKKNVLTVCFILLGYQLILELYYQYFIFVEYQAYGFKFNLNIYKYVEGKILLILFLFHSLFISRISPFIYSVFIFFLVFFLIPAIILYAYGDVSAGPLYSIVALVFTIGTVSLLKFKTPELTGPIFSYNSIFFLVLLSLLPILLNFGLHINPSNLLLSDIHTTREQFDENSITAINYLYNWQVKAIIPIVMVFFLIHKRFGYAIISLFILIYLYVISGNKIVYITSFVMLFFCFVGQNYFEKIKYFGLALIIGLLLLPLLDKYILNSHNLKGIFVMRMLFFPAHLNYDYFDFFQDKPLYFAESNFFKWFATYPYNRPVGFIIAQVYYNTTEMNANNGIISDGYMNLGYMGVVLNILIVSVIFLFFNSLNIDSKYLGIFFVMIFLFLSAPMLSMIITSGLWIIFILSFTLMRRTNQISNC